jgi:dTDP-4-dehydrorhamnose reductase
MKLLLLGADGQVGWELRRALAILGPVVACTRAQADLSKPETLPGLIAEHAPTAVVNAAAYTAVDKAESEPALAHRINAEAVGVLAAAAARQGAWLVHYSTDYVFDGTKSGAYEETDPINPLSVYGASKAAGEDAVRAAGGPHLIFRTSWVYAARGQNFPKTMLRLAKSRDELTVVADQIGAPTHAELIADVTAAALRSAVMPQGHALSGTYHLTAAGTTSWHAYAQRILALALAAGHQLRATPDKVRAITTAEFPAAARRIPNSHLSTVKLRETFGLHLPPWDEPLPRLIADLGREIAALGAS